MPIPPVGNTPIQPSRKDTGPDKSDQVKSSRVNQDTASSRARTDGPSFSAQAKRVQSLQHGISRVQVIERTARAIESDISNIEKTLDDIKQGRRTGSRRNTREIQNHLDSQVRQLRERPKEAQFDDENLLELREIKLELEHGAESIRPPDTTRGIEDYVRSTREVAEGTREATESEFMARLKELIKDAGDVRLKFEEAIREAIVESMRESSNSAPRNVREAELILNQVKIHRPTVPRQVADGMKQLEGRTVNLLK